MPFSHALEQYYIKTYNDPMSASLSTPNGWQTGVYFFEMLHTPFLLYFLFGKDGIKKELGAIVVMTQVAVVTSLFIWEAWAFDDAIVSRDQKMVLTLYMYAPFLAIPTVMVVDMISRVSRRVEKAEQVKRK